LFVATVWNFLINQTEGRMTKRKTLTLGRKKRKAELPSGAKVARHGHAFESITIQASPPVVGTVPIVRSPLVQKGATECNNDR
jgi:hypothetical protein